MARRKNRRRRPTSSCEEWAFIVGPGRIAAGAWAAGVVAGLTERGITVACFRRAIGVSAGSLCLLYFVTKQLRRGIVIWKRFINGSQLVRWWNPFILRPLLDLHYLIQEVFTKKAPLRRRNILRGTTIFEIVVTNVQNGQAEYRNPIPSNCLELGQASAALRPYFWGPVTIDGEHYLDGGFSDALPIQHAIDQGFKNILVVIARPLGWRSTSPSRFLVWCLFPFSKCMRQAFLASDERYNQALDLIEHPPAGVTIIAIRPSHALGNGFETNQKSINNIITEGEQEAVNVITRERLRRRLPNVKKIRNRRR